MMNVDIPVDIDKESMDAIIDESWDDDLIPTTIVDKEWSKRKDLNVTKPGVYYGLVYDMPEDAGVTARRRTIYYEDVANAHAMVEYMKKKKLKEGTPRYISKDRNVIARWNDTTRAMEPVTTRRKSR
jgi:hypothetical protein